MGGFSGSTNVSVVGSPQSVALGDFNQDGKQDFATANGNPSTTVSIRLGDGLGGFSGATNVGVGTHPFTVAIGDFNNDGKQDLAAANNSSPTVSIRLGDGLGGFSGATEVSASSRSVTIGDFNNDGKQDLAAANSIFLGDGLGGFSPPIIFNLGSSPFSIAIGDFNNDGKQDLAAANFSTVLIRLGRCNLTLPPTITAGATATRQQGSAGSTATIATVSDDLTAAGSIVVTATTVPVGITVTNISNSSGTITATVAADCSATTGNNTVVLTASDGTLTATANFIVNVMANSAPTLTYANPAALVFGNGATVNPATGPSDNGSVAAIAVLSQGSFTGTVSVNNTTGVVTISNAAPIGTHTLTIRATDNCGATTDAPFTVQVFTLALGGKLADPLVCTGPGSVLNVTATVANPNPVTVSVDFSATPNVPGQLLVQAGSCLATGQLTGACSTTTTQVNFSGQLAAGQTITFTYRVQVADNVAPGAALCLNSTANLNGLPLAPIQACGTLNCPLAGPGAAYPASAGVSDQKPGSVLVFNLYSSGASNSIAQNTRINLTNTHALLSTAVHLFFVDGASCSVADSYLCLTPNQTASFLVSDIDPGTTGYLVAVAVDLTGCPRNFNYLIGDEYVKLSSGHAANLGAEAFAALSGGLPPCNGSSVTAELKFDGVSYNAAPLVLAADNIGSRADGNETLLILNRLGGNLATSASTLTGVIGILYDDAESPFSFGLSGSTCQYRSIISGTTVRTTPRFEQITPAGRTGWFKVWMAGLFGMTGAILNANPNAATSAGAFNQGHNLHKLTTTNTVVLTIPVFPPSC